MHRPLMGVSRPTVRPLSFQLNPAHELAVGLNLAYLGGQFPASFTYKDESIYQYHGTLQTYATSGATSPFNQIWFVPQLGRLGLNLLTLGSNTGPAIKVPITFADNSTSHTMAWWAYRVTNVYGGYIWDFNAVAGRYIVAHDGSGTGGNGHWSFYNNGSFLDLGTAIIGAWAHYCVTLDAGATLCTPYLNGVAGTAVAYTGNKLVSGASNVFAAGGDHNFSARTAGPWADFMEWGRVLKPAEIARLADCGNVMLDGLIVPTRRFSINNFVSFDPSTVPWQADYTLPVRETLVPVPY